MESWTLFGANTLMIRDTSNRQTVPMAGADGAASASDSTREEFQCNFCDKSFATSRGQNVHRARQHKREYGQEVIATIEADQRKKGHWHHDEQYQLALNEVEIQESRGGQLGTGGIVQALIDSGVTTRTADALRKRRQTQVHKDLVLQITSERAASIPASLPEPETEQNILNPFEELYKSEILRTLETLPENYKPSNDTINNITLGVYNAENLDIINRHCKSFDRRHPTDPFQPKQQTRLILPQNHRKRRKATY